MNKLDIFTQKILETKLPKIEIACAFVWFHYVIHNEDSNINTINDYFVKSNLPKYNQTYLKDGLRKSKNVTKGQNVNSYKPQRQYLNEMSRQFSFVETRSEEIHTDDVIIPTSLFENTRGYIESLSKQINASYNHNIFDGCAILMRRLLEILLIHSYENNNKISFLC